MFIYSRALFTLLTVAVGPAFAVAQINAAAPAQPAAPIEVKPGVALPIRYKLAKPGKVSLNVYDEKGAIVREVINTAQRNAGDNMEVWDGLDKKRQPLPPGKYSWKLLSTPGLQAEYLLSTGSNYTVRPNSSWSTLAPGSIASPTYVHADATGIYVAGASENIEPAMIKQSLDGKTRFWERGLNPYNAPSNQVQIGEVVWLHVGGLKQILPINAASGGTAKNSTNPKDIKDYKAIDTYWKEGTVESAGDWMAACEGLLAVAYTKHNAIRWFDPATGKITATTTAIKAPRVLASSGADSKVLYVSDGKAIYALGKEGGEAKELISGLYSVRCMTLDPASGDILLFDGGEWGGGDSQIKRFSQDGKLIKAYGRKGGREDGVYTREQQESFRRTTSIAMMPDGGFVIAEPWSAPRRVAVFDKDGKFQREWYGGQMWAPWILPEPDNPNAVWMGSDWNGCMRMLVDPKTKTWKVHSTHSYGVSPLTEGNIGIGTGIQGAAVRNGILYFHRNGAIFQVDRAAGTWKVVAVNSASLTLGIEIRIGAMPPTIGNIATRHKTKKYKGGGYAFWAVRFVDANGDGQPQAPELAWQIRQGSYTQNVQGPFIGWWTDKNADDEVQEEEVKNDSPYIPPGNAVMDSKFNFVATDELFGVAPQYRRFHLWSPSGWTDKGVPLFETAAKMVPLAGYPEALAKTRNQGHMTRDEKSGDIYMASNDSPGWGSSKDSSMLKFGPDGTFKWSSGTAGSNPGQIRHFRGIFGVVKDCVAAPNTSYEWPGEGLRTTYVWDKDGLYVGGLLDNPVVNDSVPVWRYALGAESIFGKVWEDPKTGEVFFFGHWLNEGRIYKITGWDNWERQSGLLDLPAEAGTGGNGVLASFHKSDGTRIGQWMMQNVDFDATKELKSQTSKQIADSGKYFVRLNSRITAPADGKYSFSTRGAGNVRLLIDGRIVIDTALPAERSTLAQNPVEMKSGQRRDLQLEYSPIGSQNGRIELLWSAEGQEPAPVPSSALYAGPGEVWASVPYGKGIGLMARYWNKWERSGEPAAKRVENGDVNFKRDKNRGNAVLADWTGFLEARRTGYHRLRVEGAGSSLDAPGRSEKFVHMEAGQRYPITLLFSDGNIHPAHADLMGARLDWIEPGSRDPKPVPQSQFFPTE